MGATLTAQKLASTESAKTLTAKNGKYSLTVPAETNYAINYSLYIGSKNVSGSFYALGYYKMMLDDYESYELGQLAVSMPGTVYEAELSVVEGGIDNGKAMRVTKPGDAWPKYIKEVALDGTYNVVCLWIYSASAKTVGAGVSFEVFNKTSNYKAPKTDLVLKAGWNYIEVEMSASFDEKITAFDFHAKTLGAGTMIDRIAFKTV